VTVARRHPDWIKVRASGGEGFAATKRVVQDLGLHTVCEEAHCPNIAECWGHRTATFMLLGDVCTRNCGYCAVGHGRPTAVDPDEPERVAEGVARLGLNHVVVTSVDRDDLTDGGAAHFAATARAIRARIPTCAIEVLTPDFKGDRTALAQALTDLIGNAERRRNMGVRARAAVVRTAHPDVYRGRLAAAIRRVARR